MIKLVRGRGIAGRGLRKVVTVCDQIRLAQAAANDRFNVHFVILTTARTGSNAFVGLLNTHQSICCDYEIFHPDEIFTAGPNCFSLGDRDRRPFQFLSQVLEWRSASSAADCYGFKLFIDHDKRVLKSLIRSRRWRKILLRRDNLLDQFLSLKIARQTSAWTAFERKEGDERVWFSPAEFCVYEESILRANSEVERLLYRSSTPFDVFTYEELCKGELSTVFDLLQVSSSSAVGLVHAKQNPRATNSKVLNAEEVYEFLNSTNRLSYWVE